MYLPLEHLPLEYPVGRPFHAGLTEKDVILTLGEECVPTLEPLQYPLSRQFRPTQ